MEINKKLDTDNDIDFLESGSLAHASNIVINNNNSSIQNEHNIDVCYNLLTEGEEIVGYIACSDEFVIFTSLNRIIRYNENTENYNIINTNWSWQGGQVIGAYTYNVNNELIISITEINAREDVPLKIINLNKPNYVNGHNDKKYTLSPDIPKANLVNWSTISGSSIDKGMYCLFIRYKQGDDYTPWVSLGYPMLVYDKYNNTIVEDVSYIFKDRYNSPSATLERFTYSERTNLNTEKVNLNIQINLEIDNFLTIYEYFQLSYIVNTVKNEIKTFVTNDYNIDEKTIVLDNNFSTDITVDDITRTAFNLYNVKTLCNYNNRLYLANYKEENPNSIVSEIDISKIRVSVKDMVLATNDIINNSVSTKATTENDDDIGFGTIIKNPTSFKIGLGYIVHINFKLRNSEGNTKDVKARIFVNRFCYPDGYVEEEVDKSLVIDINSLRYAVYFNSGYLDYQSDIFTYSDQIEFSKYDYFIINIIGGNYKIKLGSAFGGSGSKKYKERWNEATRYKLPNAKYAKDDFYYGFNPPYVDYVPNSTRPSPNIKYNILTDFVITLIEEFKIDIVALNNNTSLNPLWFYNSIFTFNGNKINGEYDYNYDNSHYGNSVYDLNTGEVKQKVYYRSIIYCWMPIDISPLLKEKHINNTITFRNYHETINPIGGLYTGTNSDRADSNTLKIFIGYNISTKEYVLGTVYEGYYKDVKGFFLLDNTYKVTNNEGDITYHTLEDFLKDTDINIEFPNINKTTEDIADYYRDKTVYSWTEDIEPSEKDFNPNKQYSLIMGKYNYYDNDDKYQLEDFRPKAAGLIHINDTGNIQTVFDKHFVVYYKLMDWMISIGNVYGRDPNTSIYIVVGNTEYPAVLGDLYIVFEAKDIVDYKGKEVINGWICRPYKNTRPTDDIFAFVKYYDITVAAVFKNGKDPYIRDIGFTTPLVTNLGFYIDRFNEGGITEDSVYKSDTYKTLIDKSVYNFFIHYVYPNGTYTDGIQIPNSVTVPNKIFLGKGRISNNVVEDIYMDVDEDTIIGNVAVHYNKIKSKYISIDTSKAHDVLKIIDTVKDPRLFNVFPAYNEDGIALYKNSNGDRLFRCSNRTSKDYQYQINSGFKVVFDNIPMNDKFVGYFISYEKTEPILIGRGPIIDKAYDFNTNFNSTTNNVRFYFPEFNILKSSGGGNIMIIERYLIGGNNKRGSLFVDAYDIASTSGVSRPISDVHDITGIEKVNILAPNNINDGNAGREAIINLMFDKQVKVITTLGNGVSWATCGILLNIRDNIYTSKNKKLISLGFTKFATYQENKNYTYGYEDYPYYYDYYVSSEHVYAFNKDGVNYDEINSIPTRSTDGSLLYPKYHTVQPGASTYTRAGNTPISRFAVTAFSVYPLFAKTIKTAPIEKYYTLANDNNSFVQNVRTVYMYPAYLHDTFEISNVYVDYISKEIINYNKDFYANFVTEYKKTIRRSDVIGDESVYNTWKIFRAEQYRIISENKGNIINIVGVGIYLIAHCEHSMFIFNRDASMRTENKDVQLSIPDAFDIDYSEVFTSTKGYAGIQKFNQFVCTNYGYIFYDSDAHKIYRFDESNLDEITPGFKYLFKNNVVDINFAIDESNERLICLGMINNNGDNKYFTISYSFTAKNWISTHTYWYEDCFNTKNNTYFINNKVDKISSVDTFMKDFNSYTNVIIDDDNMFKTELDVEGKPYSFIDVVFNNNGIDKVLNYITYITNKNSDDNYSGDKLLIYTNCCYSDYINISKPKRSIKDYKNPYYRYGLWVFNWFRNKVANINTKNPIIRRDGKFYENTKIDIRRGLDNALIVGKYFVVRLIFRDDKESINVDDIQCY